MMNERNMRLHLVLVLLFTTSTILYSKANTGISMELSFPFTISYSVMTFLVTLMIAVNMI